MGLRDSVIETLFGGQKDPLANIIKGTKGSATSPAGVVTAPKGTLFIIDYEGNAADYDIYINLIGTTTWLQIYDSATQGHPKSTGWATT